MTLTPVNEVPRRACGNNNLQNLLREFVNSDHEIVKVNYMDYEYKTPTVCRNCLAVAVKRLRYRVKVMQRGDTVYLKKI